MVGNEKTYKHIDGLEQESRNCSALAIDLFIFVLTHRYVQTRHWNIY